MIRAFLLSLMLCSTAFGADRLSVYSTTTGGSMKDLPALCSGSIGWDDVNKVFYCFSGGGGNFVEVEVDFGGPTSSDFTTAVTVSANWVTNSSKIICRPTGYATSDLERPEGHDEAMIEEITCTPFSRVAATSFKLRCHAPNLGATGKFKISCTGG